MIYTGFNGVTIRVALDANTLWFCSEDLKKVLPQEWFYYNPESVNVCNKMGLEWINESLTRSIAEVIDTVIDKHDKSFLSRLAKKHKILRRLMAPNIGAQFTKWIDDNVVQAAIKKVHIYAFRDREEVWTTSMILAKAYNVKHSEVIRRLEDVYCLSGEGKLEPYQFINDFDELEQAYRLTLPLYKCMVNFEHEELVVDKKYQHLVTGRAFEIHFEKLLDTHSN